MKKIIHYLFLSCVLCTPIMTQAANPNIDSLKLLLSQEPVDSQRVHLLLAISKAYYEIPSDSCLNYIFLAKDLSDNINFQEGLARSYYQLASWELKNHNYLKAKYLFQVAIDKAKVYNLSEFLLPFYVKYLITFHENQQSDSLLIVARRALQEAQSIVDPKRKGRILVSMGREKVYQADYDSSIYFFMEALKIFESVMFKEGMIGIYNNMAVIHKRTRNIEKALQEYKKALAMCSGTDLTKLQRLLNHNIGSAYLDQEKYDSATMYLNKAYHIAKSLKAHRMAASSGISLGYGYLYLGQKKKALELFKEAEQAIQNWPQSLTQYHLYKGFAEVYEKMNDLSLAEKYWINAKNHPSIKDKPFEKRVMLKSIAEFYERTGKLEHALIEYKAYQVLLDSLNAAKQDQELQKLFTQYETSEKEKEIQLLTQENELKAYRIQQQKHNLIIGSLGIFFFLGLTIFLFYQRQKLQKTQKELKSSLSEKETLLKEIHHRVKNNLQLIISLLNLQSENDHEQTVKDFLYKGQNRIKSIALLHEQLYRSENLAIINVQDYLKHLISSIFLSFGIEENEMNISTDVDLIELDIHQAIPIGLIINELVNNSLKHAFEFPNTGTLVIKFKQSGDHLKLMIQDNGKGFEKVESASSMGLQLVKLLVRQLQGRVKMDTQNGTKVTITFNQPIIEAVN